MVSVETEVKPMSCATTLPATVTACLFTFRGEYDIPQKLKIDSRLQYGTQDNVLFFVYHDKSQTPYQERFRCNGLQQFVYAAKTVLKMAKGIDISWAVGNYLVNL